MPETFLLDNTVVSNFGQVRRFDVLQALMGGRVRLTPQVLDETRAGVAEGKIPGDILARALDDGWLGIVAPAEGRERRLFEQFLRILDRGEASCLAVGLSRRWVVATDDRQARKVANETGIVVTGTLGLLVVAIDRALIDLATGNELLTSMISLGYHSPVLTLDGYFAPSLD